MIMATKKQEIKKLPQRLEPFWRRLIPADRILHIAEERKKSEAGVVYDELLKEFADWLWQKHSKPKHNPRYGVYDDKGRLDQSAIFQVHTIFYTKLSETQEEMGLESHFLLELQEAGLTEENARLFVKNEVHIYPRLPLTLDEFLFGRYEEGEFEESTDIQKSIGRKLQAFLVADEGEEVEYLTAEEKQVVNDLETERFRIRPGIFERLHQYVDSPKMLFNLLKFLKPKNYISNAKYGESMTDVDRSVALGGEAAEMIGLKNGKA